MAAEAFFGHFRRFGFPDKFDQFAVGRAILFMSVVAAHRPLVPFLVTVHALPMVDRFKPDSPGKLGVETGLVTGGTPGNFRSHRIRRPIMMAGDTIFEKRCVFLVHKSNGSVKVFFFPDYRVI